MDPRGYPREYDRLGGSGAGLVRESSSPSGPVSSTSFSFAVGLLGKFVLRGDLGLRRGGPPPPGDLRGGILEGGPSSPGSRRSHKPGGPPPRRRSR